MNFVWSDYHPGTMGFVETWLDEDAVKSTGLDEGFGSFYDYWSKKEGFTVGENFWCKVVSQNDKPFAVVAFCRHECKILIMELLIQPEKRGQGNGTKLLAEFLQSEEFRGCAIEKWEAVIFPDNIASRKAFEKTGFRYHHSHEDGNALYYVHEG